MKVASVFSTSGHTAGDELGKRILPQLEDSQARGAGGRTGHDEQLTTLAAGERRAAPGA